METTLLSQRERIQTLSEEYERLTVEQLTLEALAHSESELQRRVADLEADNARLRDLLRLTLTQLDAANARERRRRHQEQPSGTAGRLTMGHVRAILTGDDIQWDLQPEECPPADDDLLTAALIDAASYRALSHALLHALHDLHQHYAMTTGEQYHRAVDDLGWEREAV